jgi:glutaminyl-peptide cyclotransferase
MSFVLESDTITNRMSPLVNFKWKRPTAYLSGSLFLFLILALFSSCNQTPVPAPSPTKPAVLEQLVPKVLAVLPHDITAFTEGLLWHDGVLYESSGLYGKSNLREVDPQTGSVRRRIDDPVSVFGEGIALNGNQLLQLTWREHVGYVYDLNTLAQIGKISYDGEGWGLCFDGQYFFMSNGSASIYKRDPKTFAVLGSVQIMQAGKPIDQLNELECVGDSIYANVWKTNNILRIDKGTGAVTGVIDASGLLTPQELAQAGSDGVLNGIAYDPDHSVFLITGKLWPKLFEVQFIPKTNN